MGLAFRVLQNAGNFFVYCASNMEPTIVQERIFREVGLDLHYLFMTCTRQSKRSAITTSNVLIYSQFLLCLNISIQRESKDRTTGNVISSTKFHKNYTITKTRAISGLFNLHSFVFFIIFLLALPICNHHNLATPIIFK